MAKPTRPRETHVIGIDCATNPKNVGLALCTMVDGHPRIEQVATAKSWPDIDERVASWVAEPTILAFDAPLGWPVLLGDSLRAHNAGHAFHPPPNAMFRRATDDAVAKRLGKRPLDVGADRIARTAHAALSLLARLRSRLHAPIPLAWEQGSLDTVAAIEVYPAGTLAALNWPRSGYKGSGDEARSIRRQLTAAIRRELPCDTHASELMIGTDHALDAVLCVLAGLDFLAGRAVPPDDLPLAKREGWIWVRRRLP